MTTGQLIKEARKRAGMTQKQLGEKLGISYVNISQLENDQRIPKYETVLSIATALGVEWLELVPEDKQGQIVIDHVMGKLRAAGKPHIDTELVSAAVDGAVQAQYPELYEYEEEMNKIDSALSLLNSEGRHEAVKRVEELTEIPRYRRQDASQSPVATSCDEDPTPPPDAPETPSEGK